MRLLWVFVMVVLVGNFCVLRVGLLVFVLIVLLLILVLYLTNRVAWLCWCCFEFSFGFICGLLIVRLLGVFVFAC